MPRAVLPQNFRPSDVIRVSANGKGMTGRRSVVVSREIFDATVKVLYRGNCKDERGRAYLGDSGGIHVVVSENSPSH
jgi:hypothetical protein